MAVDREQVWCPGLCTRLFCVAYVGAPVARRQLNCDCRDRERDRERLSVCPHKQTKRGSERAGQRDPSVSLSSYLSRNIPECKTCITRITSMDPSVCLSTHLSVSVYILSTYLSIYSFIHMRHLFICDIHHIICRFRLQDDE